MSLLIHATTETVSRQHPTTIRRFRHSGWFRLIAGIVSMWLLHILLLTVIHGLSHALPAERELGICEGLPCFRGITPGITGWAEARLIAEAWGSGKATIATIVYKDTYGTITLYRSADNLTVGTIDVVMASDSHLTIGDVIGQFGSPCGVSFYSYPNNGLVILHYPLAAMSAQASNSLSEDLPVQSITISTAGQRANLPIDPCGTDDPGLGSQYVNRPWRGFTSLKHYLAKGT